MIQRMLQNKRRFGLIGYPLDHSFSPTYFEKKFRRENIEDAEYLLFPLSDITQIRHFVKQNPTLQGFNITHPYKKEILPFLDDIDDEAARVSAVNCVLVQRIGTKNLLKGYNTDVIGFAQTLAQLHLDTPTAALILGTGGAAQAVATALKKSGCSITFVSRSKKSNTLTYESLTSEIIRQHPLIINTTPLGMFPNNNNFPHIDYENLTQNHTLIDLIYNPEETLFLKKGKAKGAQICNGMTMLISQAEASWKIWNNNF